MIDNWYRVIWTYEAIFEIVIDTQSCYVTQKHGNAIEYRYIKPIFKNRRSSIGIWGSHYFGFKRFGPVFTKKGTYEL